MNFHKTEQIKNITVTCFNSSCNYDCYGSLFFFLITGQLLLENYLHWISLYQIVTKGSSFKLLCFKPNNTFFNLLFSFIYISWRLITSQYCSGFCHTLIWISHGFTCVPHSILFFFTLNSTQASPPGQLSWLIALWSQHPLFIEMATDILSRHIDLVLQILWNHPWALWLNCSGCGNYR